jgi:protein unc-45
MLCDMMCTGIQQLLTVAGTIPEHKTIEVTQSSRMLVSLCLSKIYDDLISDKDRDLFTDATNAYFT